MIGQMPNRLRPLPRKKRTLPRSRRATPRGERAPRLPSAAGTGPFAAARDLPAAQVVVPPRTLGALVGGGIAMWLVQRWAWLRPRTIPVAFAFVGFLGIVQAYEYLTNMPMPAAKVSGYQAKHAGPLYSPSKLRITVSQ